MTEQSVVVGLSGVPNISPAAFANGLLDVIKIPYGSQATLVNFSEASFGGTAIVTVPEPVTFALLVSGFGVIALLIRRPAK